MVMWPSSIIDKLSCFRQLFERVIQLKVSVKKMKFFFKKYLEFEQRHGTEESVEAVKQKATDYVESKVVT